MKRCAPRTFWKGQGGAAAFTLIELLIVVAIIAILAAIAVPNFLEAQVRSKVSRARSDLRTVATALEAYAVDHGRYPPNDGVYNVLPAQISTPVAYLTAAYLVDPFSDKEKIYRSDVPDPDLARFYTYDQIVRFGSMAELDQWVEAGNPRPSMLGADCPDRNLGALERYGPWRLSSNGPDRRFSTGDRSTNPFNPNPLVLLGCDVPYDPTNGTMSTGNIVRTQKDARQAPPGG
jgi:type II secretion system protein G